MGRKLLRQGGLRERIAAAAARIMAEDGVDDFALAKRKAVRQLGAQESQALPRNDEIEEQLRAYRALYQAEAHGTRLAELRRVALEAMRALAPYNPYLTGPVLRGTAGPHATIELQLFPEDPRAVELYLLEQRIPYSTFETHRYAGDRAHAVAQLALEWSGERLRLSVCDARDERLAMKTTQAGRALERAGLGEVDALVAATDGAT